VEVSRYNSFISIIQLWPALAAELLTLPEEEGPDFNGKLRYVSVKIFWAAYRYTQREMVKEDSKDAHLDILSPVMHRMSNFTLNDRIYHPLINDDVQIYIDADIPLWKFIIDTWITEDGSRMRLINATARSLYEKETTSLEAAINRFFRLYERTADEKARFDSIIFYLQNVKIKIRSLAAQKIPELTRVLSAQLAIDGLVELTKSYAYHRSILDLVL
jgi:hypothetical protein